jgi:propionate CoA-transferase
MRARVMPPREAVDLIKDGDTVVIGGSGGGVTEATALLRVIGERYEAASRPRDLTLVHSTCLNFFAHEGIVRREIGGHYVMSPKFTKMVLDNKLEAYNFLQGVLIQLYREIAGAGRESLPKSDSRHMWTPASGAAN